MPGIWVKDADGNLSAQVDKQGRFFTLGEMDAEYRKNNVNEELYGEYAGRFVKNAYDPNLTPDDPTLDIDWPLAPQEMILSEKDKEGVRFTDADLFE